ncbi:MAG: metalloregulator ArsR/SmtB family transcription factor [Candidatus Eisenbacteria bacterium]|nr:metalloregulator ArsR/SmtB family transcription factor [Candidatus Eisenbacteria bacterium]
MKAAKDFAEAARLLKLLGHPARLKVVCGLLGEPASLSRISREIGVPVSTLAQHLSVLRREGILEEERRGVEIFFRVADQRVPGILLALCAASPSGRGRRTPASLPRWKWRELHG